MAGLLDNRECWLHEGWTLNQLLDQPGVKAAGNDGHHWLLDPRVVQLLVLRDAALIVSRAVSMRVSLLPDVIHAIAATNRAVRNEVVHLDSKR